MNTVHHTGNGQNSEENSSGAKRHTECINKQQFKSACNTGKTRDDEIIDKDYNERKVEFFDEDGYLVNIMNLKNIRKLHDRELPTLWEMIPADEEGKMTVIEIVEAEFDVPIEDNFFSQQNMKRVR